MLAVRRALLIYNPAAGRRRQRRLLRSVLPELERGGFGVEVVPTDAPGDATRLARDAAGAGAELVFVLGGDGTVREAAAGLLGGDVPLAILPGGTANVLAHTLRLPAAAAAAARAHAGHAVRRIDVGECAGQVFLMMASGGFDAFVLEHLDPGLKAHLGKLGIAVQGLLELPRYRYPLLHLQVDGADRWVSFFAVCNIPFYAGTVELCPPARPDDRRLDLIAFDGRGMLETVSFGFDLARGAHLQRPDVEVVPVEDEVVVLGPPDAAVQIDGDPAAGRPPVRVALSRHTLPVLAPAETG